MQDVRLVDLELLWINYVMIETYPTISGNPARTQWYPSYLLAHSDLKKSNQFPRLKKHNL